MTETGWIIVGIIVLAVILLVALTMRRKPGGAVPVETPTEALIPEQVQPEPVVTAEVAPPPPPQTIAAEEVPVAVAETAASEPAPVAVEPEPEIPAVPVVAPEPVVISAAPAPATPAGDGDNLLKLKGVGPKIATLLKSEGITRFAEIAAWTDADLAAIDAKLGSFAGRPKRDNWVDQARFLATGDVAGYEAKYGKL